MQWLWLFLPDEALVLVIALIGLALMVGFLRPRSAGQLLAGIIMMLLLAPFVESLVSSLPWWVSILILIGVGWAILRSFARLVLGAGAADEMVGTLAADVVRGTFRGVFFLLFFPFRIVGWLFRRI